MAPLPLAVQTDDERGMGGPTRMTTLSLQTNAGVNGQALIGLLVVGIIQTGIGTSPAVAQQTAELLNSAMRSEAATTPLRSEILSSSSH